MSKAFDEACRSLQIVGDARARETLAIRIIELAQDGELDPEKLRDQIVSEASGLEQSEKLRTLQAGFELLDRHSVDASRTTIGSDLQIRFVHLSLVDVERLARLVHRRPPVASCDDGQPA
jgi:hypothetical protein